MKFHKLMAVAMALIFGLVTSSAAPAIDPIANVTIPAGKSLILPITATSPTGSPLTYTITSSTSGIAVVMHTNNPFWQLSVAQAATNTAPGAYQTPFRGGLTSVTNLGTMTFMLFPEYAPHTVNVFQGLTMSGFYNSNTIFHRVVTNTLIQGGDPKTNGTGGLVFQYDDEYNAQAIFSGSGQLGLANSGKDTDGCQFFVTVGPQRWLDFGYPLFGQLVRGFNVLSNIDSTAINTDSRPLANEIIQRAAYVPDTADTVITLTGTNVAGTVGTLTVTADDGQGGQSTVQFTATTVTDTNSDNGCFIDPNAVSEVVGPENQVLTNYLNAYELDGDTNYWFPYYADTASQAGILTNSLYNESNSILQTLTYNVTNVQGQLQMHIFPKTNYVGALSLYLVASYSAEWNIANEYGESPLPAYDQKQVTFILGDTPISGQPNVVSAVSSVAFTNLLLATFTNGAPASGATNFTAFINWGDNQTNSGAILAGVAGVKGVFGSHTYAYPGSYPVYLTVQSKIGASTTILSWVNVTNASAAATSSLTLQTVGQGTVSPNYNNSPLIVGDIYSVSATPASQWTFTGWTDGNGYVLGAKTNLSFTMSRGLTLTATFADTVRPVLKVTNLASVQQVSNSFFTVTGTASNNWQVAGVEYQLNGTGWTAATGTTSWSAGLNLTPGTNIFQVYAVDGVGTTSVTNTNTVIYVVSAPLQLAATGLGTLNPNYSNAVLAVGQKYTITATPATGFVVTNWTISTNWLGGRITNSATVQFVMVSNLTMQVNFAEVTKPVLTITAPTAGQRMTNALATFAGTARDNWQVSGVWCQLNSNAWSLVTATTNNYTNWTQTLPLVLGTNTFRAYALDLGGNLSPTNTLNVISSNTFLLQLAFTNSPPMSTNGPTFTVQASKGLNGHVQVSSDLISWTNLATFAGSNSSSAFRDPAATNSPHRFYRAVVP